MNKLIVLSILVIASLFAGTAHADKPIVKIKGFDKETIGKAGAGALLDITGLGPILGVTSRGEVETKAVICLKGRRSSCAIDQKGTVRLP